MGLINDISMISMMSSSKGYYGECGKRGGYMEVSGMSPAVIDELYKLASINLSPNTSGQITMATGKSIALSKQAIVKLSLLLLLHSALIIAFCSLSGASSRHVRRVAQ